MILPIAALLAGSALLGFVLGGVGVGLTVAACVALFVGLLYGSAGVESPGLVAVLFILLVAPVAVGVSTFAWNFRARRRERGTASG